MDTANRERSHRYLRSTQRIGNAPSILCDRSLAGVRDVLAIPRICPCRPLDPDESPALLAVSVCYEAPRRLFRVRAWLPLSRQPAPMRVFLFVPGASRA